jgi:FSR family fosmidomycin resistance protein-like MFS transporter
MTNGEKPAFPVLWSICGCHLINDMLQSLLVATYPTLKSEFHLGFAEIGLVTLSYQLTASLLQPIVGWAADRRPTPFSLPVGTLFPFAGLLTMSLAHTYGVLVTGACILRAGLVGLSPGGVAGGAHGLGQPPGHGAVAVSAWRQRRGALGPLAAALVVLRWGRRGLGAFSLLALVSAVVLTAVGVWYRRHRLALLARGRAAPGAAGDELSVARVGASFAVLLVLIFSKFSMVSGLFFGLSFGAAGTGAALMGRLADATSLATVFTGSARSFRRSASWRCSFRASARRPTPTGRW